MLTWHLDRLARSATVCLVTAVVLAAGIGFLIDARSDVENVLGGMLVGALIIGVGGVAGSTVTSGAGCLLLGVVAALAKPSAPLLVVTGTALLVALLLVDLSITTRRAPLVDRSVWLDAAVTVAVTAVIAAGLFALAWFVATRAVWQAIAVPFGVIALGYAMRFSADAHRDHAGP